LTSPPNPAVTATRPAPPREVHAWWIPRRWAPLTDCTRGKVGEVVEWMWRVEEPLAEKIAVGVGASENMSVM